MRLVLALASLLALVGCADATSTAPAAPAVSAPASSAVTEQARLERIYVATLHRYGIPLTEQEMTTIGPRICSAFDQGLSYGAVERGVLNGEPQLSQTQAGQLIGSAIGAYCLRHAGKVG